MREILFRGKRIDNGEWVEGGYARIDPPPVCFTEDKDKAGEPEDCIVIETGCSDWGMPRHYGMCPVDPSTIGQYTGLEDRNGKKIFEGDIISGGALSCNDGYSIANNTSIVSFKKGMFFAGGISLNSFSGQCSVVGNLYDK